MGAKTVLMAPRYGGSGSVRACQATWQTALVSIADRKYVSLTTYRSDGTTKSLPVWIADLGDGTVGFTTASSSFKVKRMGADPRVELQPSTAKGEILPDTASVTGTAAIFIGGAEFERCRSAIVEKYGIQFRAIEMVGKIAKWRGKGAGTDAAVKITLD